VDFQSSPLAGAQRVGREARPGHARRKGARADTAKSRSMSDENQNKTAPALGPYVMRAIGRELRAMYADIVAEGVSDRFAEILRKLDEPSNEGETR
jgi:hypothetical protein